MHTASINYSRLGGLFPHWRNASNRILYRAENPFSCTRNKAFFYCFLFYFFLVNFLTVCLRVVTYNKYSINIGLGTRVRPVVFIYYRFRYAVRVYCLSGLNAAVPVCGVGINERTGQRCTRRRRGPDGRETNAARGRTIRVPINGPTRENRTDRGGGVTNRWIIMEIKIKYKKKPGHSRRIRGIFPGSSGDVCGILFLMKAGNVRNIHVPRVYTRIL